MRRGLAEEVSARNGQNYAVHRPRGPMFLQQF